MACKLIPASRRIAGFTLVELLVSLVVLALVALTMMGGLRFVLLALSSTDMRREALEELTLGFAVLRSELERAEPLMRKAGTREFVLFEGEPNRVRFVNVEPPYRAGLPYLAYEYAVEPEGDSYRIELRRARLDPAAPDLGAVQAGEPRTVVRVGQELRFTYFGALKEREQPRWQEEWPPGQRLPLAVRLAAGEEPGWPDLVVSLRIRVPWYCGVADADSSAGCTASPEDARRLGQERNQEVEADSTREDGADGGNGPSTGSRP